MGAEFYRNVPPPALEAGRHLSVTLSAVLRVALVTSAAEANEDWQMVRDVAGHHRANDVA
jgi:hypothetical protein